MCYVPSVIQNPSNGEMLQHIVENSMKYYTKYINKTNLMILCEDGARNFKPAVRTQRESLETTPFLNFYREHKPEVRTALIQRIAQMSTNVLFIRGKKFNDHQSKVSCFFTGDKNLETQLKMELYTETSKQVEGDTLMYDAALYVRTVLPHALILLVSKDSDLIGIGLTVAETHGLEALGNTIIGFINPMMGLKRGPLGVAETSDFDTSVGKFKWIPRKTKECIVHLNDGDVLTNEGSNSLWMKLYDCKNLKYFKDEIVQIEKLMLFNTYPPHTLSEVFRKLFRLGYRGPIFRKIIDRLVQEECGEALFEALQQLPEKSAVAHKWLRGYFQNCLKDGFDRKFKPLAMSNIPSVLQCAKMYQACDTFEFGTYGDYLASLSNDTTRYFRMVTPEFGSFKGPIVGMILSGTDYNMGLQKFGTLQFIAAISNPRFRKTCEDYLPNEENWENAIGEIASTVNIGTRATLSSSEKRTYAECVWRTLIYTYKTWTMSVPSPDETFGYIPCGEERTFMFPELTQFHKYFTTGSNVSFY